MPAYYNELDPYAAQWLRNLIAAGHIAPGDVDERDIREVQAGDLAGYTQCHFFAGIGGWSYAARLAGWPDDKPLWTGSPPCQPFSCAGPEKGTSDERHLWPELYRLIRAVRPSVFVLENVTQIDKWGVLDEICDGLEDADYEVWPPLEIPAAGVGARHVRYRTWVLAHTHGARLEGLHAARGRDDLQPASAPVSRHDWQATPRVLRRVNGLSARLDRPPAYREAITAFGNAIVPQVAAEILRVYTDPTF